MAEHQRNRERRLEYRREYRKRPHVKAQIRAKKKRDYHSLGGRIRERRKWLRRKYGLEPEDFDALVISQTGRCAICSAQFGPTHKHTDHVDHCHRTGRIRGLLCHLCNVGIGLFRDSPALLSKARRYLLGGEQASPSHGAHQQAFSYAEVIR